MIYLDNNNKVYSLFDINEFTQLHSKVFTIAPSVCDYNLNNLINTLEPQSFFNKSNIQDSINIDNYSLYLAYDNNIYIEFIKQDDEYANDTLW